MMPEPSGEFVGDQASRGEFAGFPLSELASKSPSTIAASVFDTQNRIMLKSMKIKPTRQAGAVLFKVVIFSIDCVAVKGESYGTQ